MAEYLTLTEKTLQKVQRHSALFQEFFSVIHDLKFTKIDLYNPYKNNEIKQAFKALGPEQLEVIHDALGKLAESFICIEWVFENKNGIINENPNLEPAIKKIFDARTKMKKSGADIDAMQLRLQRAFKDAVTEKIVAEPENAPRLKKMKFVFPGSE